MSVNAATIIGGPAIVQFRGATFYSKGEIKLESSKATFQIAVDRYGGSADERVQDETLKVSFAPAGEWESLSVLWPYAASALGTLVTPGSLTVSSINTTTDELTVTGHGLTTADAVLVHVATGGTLATGLANTTTYYARAVDADTLTLHDTAAHATANTDKINITASGTGTHYVDRDYPLVIHTFAGTKITFHNAAVVTMPNIRLASTESLIGEVEFEAFIRNGANWSDANSRYTIEQATLSDTSFSPANIKTQPYTGAWGATAPWDSFNTTEGFSVDFNLSLAPISTDGMGIVSRRLADLSVSAKFRPLGITESQILAKLLLQDTGAVRGRSLSGDNLLISATGVYVQLYGGALTTGPQSFSSKTDRLGDMEIRATRTFSTGVPNPLFYVGTTAP